MSGFFKAAETAPAKLALITEVGPPDCPMTAFPFIKLLLFIS